MNKHLKAKLDEQDELIKHCVSTASANVETNFEAKMRLAVQSAQAELMQRNDEQLKSAPAYPA